MNILKDNPHLGFKYALSILVGVLLFSPASAESFTAYDVEITSEYVKSTGKCSCGLSDYDYHQVTFHNQCPNCGSQGTLQFEQSLKTNSQEGMWYCTVCDCDFCLVCGKEHRLGTDLYLTTYNLTQPEPEPEINTDFSIKWWELLNWNFTFYSLTGNF